MLVEREVEPVQRLADMTPRLEVADQAWDSTGQSRGAMWRRRRGEFAHQNPRA